MLRWLAITTIVAIMAVMMLGCLYDTNKITVFAAASLKEPFEGIADDFEEDTGTRVELNFESSTTLRIQIENGAYADVFASADPLQIEILKSKGVVNESYVFAKNELVVAISNNSNISSLEDLANKKLRIVIAQPGSPIGKYTQEVLLNLNNLYGEDFYDKVMKNVVSEEDNVKSAYAKILLGEADAAFVYRTDSVHTRFIEIPKEYNVIAEYEIAPITPRGREFVRYILSNKDVLRRYGFIED
ncbi:molybdate ABC transporter substrate-binding protein [Methanosarcinales archaeon]|nr:MAG: molybdate ABC transporter substrate-binding protein [Methanosarcinales archaeon]